ncbi:MAG: AmmeMemoRadiSam system protein B [Candidatus Marinimicrobia bacterium]|nr:AmmeMemoRadiSam system protein B [Candidatus Neomarinimicrobiota bacterium]
MKRKILLSGFIIVLFVGFSCSQTRKPYLAGSWYPKNKTELKNTITHFFDKVEMDQYQENIVPFGLISPHAGIRFSGPVASYGYSLLNDQNYDIVILLGSSHKYNLGKISIYNGDLYKTPLGKTPVNKKITEKLLSKNNNFVFKEYVHKNENSLELQMPFLQYQLKDFSVVPILTSTNNFSLLDMLANSLIEIIKSSDKKILIVGSTDMSHYHDYRSAVKMDRHTIDLIVNNKWEKLKKEISLGNSELCGYYAIYTFLKIMKEFENDNAILLNYKNSGDIMKNTRSQGVVGYSSIAFTNKKNSSKSELNSEDKKYLLELTRKSIKYYLDHQRLLKVKKPISEILNAERAVFVTLKKDCNLRGCIGQLHAQMSLYKAVLSMSVSAAFNDHRFSPLTDEEFDDINIEISVLTPMQKIDNIDEIKMGRDGVYIKKRNRSGVFLPQVATETNWDKITFLENLCSHKAFLSKDAYKDDDTDIYIFQVEKFREK